MRRSVATLVGPALLAVAASCGSPAQEPQPSPAKPPVEDGARAALRAEGTSIAPGDADAIATFVGLPGRWNAAAAPLVRDYRDPGFPVDRWVQEAPGHIAELRAVRDELRACVATIEDPGIKRTFEEISANYGVKLDSVVALHDAVATRDQAGEEQARQDLSAAAVEGQKLAQALLDRLKPYVDPQVLTEELRKRGTAIDTLMAPR